MPRLRVRISSPGSAYPPTQLLPVNSPNPTPLKTPHFEGEVSVWVKDYTGDEKKGEGHEYFDSEGRSGMTYAIVVRGRFLDEIDADELVFGNLFQKPIRDQLPWGTSIAIKAMQFLDPSIQLDVYADKPWALSPTLATFNYLSLSKDKPEYAPTVTEKSLARLHEMCDTDDDVETPPPSPASSPADERTARKKWLNTAANRERVTVGKDTWVGMEFCNGYLDFNTLSARLPPPFNLTFPLLQYWDGQPVTYVCKRRANTDGEGDEKEEQDQGTVYFAVAFEIVDEQAIEDLKSKGKDVVASDEEGEGAEADAGDVD